MSATSEWPGDVCNKLLMLFKHQDNDYTKNKTRKENNPSREGNRNSSIYGATSEKL